MKEKYIFAHMKVAYIYAELSSCNRRKVGCVIVKDNSIISIGYNGTNPGDNNNCEDDQGNTLSTVRHAEDNALRKLTKTTNNANGAIAFITAAPCIHCAPRLIDAGIIKIYYDEEYRNQQGIDYLKNHNIDIEKLKKQE